MHDTTRCKPATFGAAWAIPLSLILIAGCAGDPATPSRAASPTAKQTQAPTPVERHTPAQEPALARAEHPWAEAAPAATSDVDPQAQTMTDAAPAAGPERPRERVLYFDTDASQVQTADLELIQDHARYLAAHPQMTLRLAGHADARGPEPYNRALSERRAAEVQRLLVENGAPAERILTEAHGASRPESEGWAENRRVEFEYTEGVAVSQQKPLDI